MRTTSPACVLCELDYLCEMWCELFSQISHQLFTSLRLTGRTKSVSHCDNGFVIMGITIILSICQRGVYCIAEFSVFIKFKDVNNSEPPLITLA